MPWMLKKVMYRAFQLLTKFLLRVAKFPMPKLFSGSGSVNRVAEILKTRDLQNVLIVTDKILMDLGLLKGLLKSLDENSISYTIFDGVQPNPTIQNVEDGLKLYLSKNCRGIIAFGGGSPIDCAKYIGARAAKPGKSVRKMAGLSRVMKRIPYLIAIPTTAGTGSETTIAAVVTDPATKEKFYAADFNLVPRAAVLDPDLLVGLPPHITSTTGIDALTHAVECYIGSLNTKFTIEYAEKAVKIIFNDLEAVYRNGSDLEKRNNMLLASYYAGAAFTRAMVGYVHAIAHNMGGMYGVPHGLANAVILPYVLEYSRKDAEKKLAKLAIAGGIGKAGESDKDLSIKFIEKIKSMNRNMKIPERIKELQEKDIPLIAKRALKEANPNYAVPTLMNQKQCEEFIRKNLLPSK